MRSASTPGPAVVFSATVASSSGKVGESETTFWKSALALRTSACDSRSALPSGSSIASTRARRKGSVWSSSTMRNRARPWTTRRTLPSGCLSTL